VSEFNVEVVKIGPVERHPNADSLSITQVHGGYPVIFRTGDYIEGSLAVYIPVDSVMPDTERWTFLKGHRRIKAKKIRGVFSMGMLVDLPNCGSDPYFEFVEGQNVQSEFDIKKYEPVVHGGTFSHADNEPPQQFIPKYTDIEGYRRNSDLLKIGEQVVITEKLHGANGRWLYRDGRFWVGSHNHLKKEDVSDIWWRSLDVLGREKLKLADNFVFYGEVLGVQDLRYGHNGGNPGVRIFDMFDSVSGKYIDYEMMSELCDELGIDCCPQLYTGAWHKGLIDLAEGKTLINDVNHIREGFVVRPLVERWDRSVGRVILKVISEGYLLRKEG